MTASTATMRDPSPRDRKAELARVFSDASAFGSWYDDALAKVYGYLLVRCGGDASLAEDLTQQTFLQAVRKRETYDGRSDAVTWLCAIARNRLADHHRQVAREDRRHLRLVVREISVGEAAPEPATFIEREAVIAALHALPALQRAALVLCYLDGMSVREASRVLGKSEGATASLLNRGKAQFRAVYGEASDG